MEREWLMRPYNHLSEAGAAGAGFDSDFDSVFVSDFDSVLPLEEEPEWDFPFLP